MLKSSKKFRVKNQFKISECASKQLNVYLKFLSIFSCPPVSINKPDRLDICPLVSINKPDRLDICPTLLLYLMNPSNLFRAYNLCLKQEDV